MFDLKLPFVIDKVNNKPSVTLMFAYFSFLLTFSLIVYIALYDSIMVALVASFVLFLISIFFYRARRVDTIKVSRDGFEIGDGGSDNNQQSSPVVRERTSEGQELS